VAATLTQSSARVPASCAARASCALRTLTCFCSWQIALARKSGLVRTDGNYIRYDGSSLSLREPDGELDGVAAAVSLPRFCAGHRVSEVVVPPTGGPMAHDPRRPGAAGASSSAHAVPSPLTPGPWEPERWPRLGWARGVGESPIHIPRSTAAIPLTEETPTLVPPRRSALCALCDRRSFLRTLGVLTSRKWMRI